VLWRGKRGGKMSRAQSSSKRKQQSQLGVRTKADVKLIKQEKGHEGLAGKGRQFRLAPNGG
jgi:hypothetical protein